MSDRKPIDLHSEIMNIRVDKRKMDTACNKVMSFVDYSWLYKEGHRDARYRTAELSIELNTTHEELLSKAEVLGKRYQQKCKMFNSQSALLRLKEDKIRELLNQRDTAAELLERVIDQGGIHTVTSMDIVEFLAGIISCIENPISSYQDVAEYSEKISRAAINQIGEK